MDTIEKNPEQDFKKYAFPHGPEAKKTYSRNMKRNSTSAKTSKVHTETHAFSNFDVNLITEEHKISLDYGECKDTLISNPLEDILFEKEISEKNDTEEDKKSLSAHISKDHSQVTINICQICGLSYKCKHSLNDHIAKVHEGKTPVTVINACSQCSAIFKGQKKLKECFLTFPACL